MSSDLLQVLSAAGAGAPAEPPFWVTVMPFVLMGLIFWFLILRPQMKRQKEHATKIAAIKKGDQVLTAGGLVGKVVKVDGHYADIELAPNVKVKAVKSTISDIVDPTANPAAND